MILNKFLLCLIFFYEINFEMLQIIVKNVSVVVVVDDQCRSSCAVCKGCWDLHQWALTQGMDPHRGQQKENFTGLNHFNLLDKSVLEKWELFSWENNYFDLFKFSVVENIWRANEQFLATKLTSDNIMKFIPLYLTIIMYVFVFREMT